MIYDSITKLNEIKNNSGMESDASKAIQEILTVISFLDDVLIDDIVSYIEDHFEGEFDEDNVEEAKSYLGDPVFYEDMDDAEIVDCANELQIEYFRHEADIYHLLDKAIEIYEG